MSRIGKLPLIAGALVAAIGTAFAAQDDGASEMPREDAPPVMQDGNMMPMMGMMRQMSVMMEACNRMMQAHAGEHAQDDMPTQRQQ